MSTTRTYESKAGGRWLLAARSPLPTAQIALALCVAVLGACTNAPTVSGGPDPSPRINAPRGLFTEVRFGVRVSSGVQYGTAPVRNPTATNKALYLDVYEPTGSNLPTVRPGIVVAHGGGFTGGSRTDIPPVELCNALASRGYVCVSIDYRLQRDDPPTQGATARDRAARAAVEDLGTALQWMRGRAGSYGIDANRIAVGGSSAGASAAMLLTYAGANTVPPARAVVDLWGSLDIYVSSMRPGGAPIIVIHGVNDPLVSISKAQQIVMQAQSVGIPVAFFPLTSPGHSHNLNLVVQGETLVQQIANFLYIHLQLDALGP